MAQNNVDSGLPRDPDNNPIQVLAPSTIVNAAVSGTSARSALPSGAQVVEVSLSTDSYIQFGDSTVTASSTASQVFPKGVAVYRVPSTATHVAYIRDSVDGRISITKLL